MASSEHNSLGAKLLAGAALFFLWTSLHPARAEAPQGVARFAHFDGVRVHYTDYGKGEFALVFVHGWNCDETVWQKQASALAEQTHVITVDLPGHGESDKPQVDYTMALHARALDAVLQDAGATSAVLVGHSNGTPVVRQFYRLCPEKVRGLVIVDGALRSFGDAAMMEKFIAPLRGRDYELTAGRFIAGMTAPMKKLSERKQVQAMMLRAPQKVAVSEMEGLLDPELWEPTKIEVPVLMILARQPAWTLEYEQFIRTLIPQVDYQTWEGVSHFVMMDKPREFNAALSEFLTKYALVKRSALRGKNDMRGALRSLR